MKKDEKDIAYELVSHTKTIISFRKDVTITAEQYQHILRHFDEVSRIFKEIGKQPSCVTKVIKVGKK